jgi:hypothetical protein
VDVAVAATAAVVGAGDVVVGVAVGPTPAVVGAGDVVVGVAVGPTPAVVGAGDVVVDVAVTPFATVKFARLLEVVPSDRVNTTLMLCDPSTSFFVSYGTAVSSPAVPAKSNGGSVSVRRGDFLRHELSR